MYGRIVNLSKTHRFFLFGARGTGKTSLLQELVIVEIMRRFAYREIDFDYSYLATRGGAEVDLVISRGKKVIALVEIKSGKEISERHLKHLRLLAAEFPGAALLCLYGGTVAQTFSASPETGREIRALPWLAGVEVLMSLA
jgi:predicted AAA+ superfamily ATPase